jgi:hypothetical protein
LIPEFSARMDHASTLCPPRRATAACSRRAQEAGILD